MSQGSKPRQESPQITRLLSWATGNSFWSSTSSGSGKHYNVNLNNGNVQSSWYCSGKNTTYCLRIFIALYPES
uniref:Uncharacterized protein n=1 Tax=Vibrio splendidus TaxID=29497 RepID=A0A0H3ZPZ3_VIBSP|nr:hypothetical protein [Vibrio splendidus]